jgi:hypothetical protein
VRLSHFLVAGSYTSSVARTLEGPKKVENGSFDPSVVAPPMT